MGAKYIPHKQAALLESQRHARKIKNKILGRNNRTSLLEDEEEDLNGGSDDGEGDEDDEDMVSKLSMTASKTPSYNKKRKLSFADMQRQLLNGNHAKRRKKKKKKKKKKKTNHSDDAPPVK